jgi:hypothetical protein
MKKNKFFPVVVFSLVLVGTALLAGCQGSQLVQAVDLALGPVQGSNVSFQEPEDILAYRWLAMAKVYEEKGMLNNRLDDSELLAYRWNAMAQAYEDNGMLNYHSNPDDLLAYRWNAMAKAYEKMGLLNDKMDPDELLAYRWNAMAEYYAKLGLLNTP